MFRSITFAFCSVWLAAISASAQSTVDFRDAISAARAASVVVKVDTAAHDQSPLARNEGMKRLQEMAGDRFSIEAWIPDNPAWNATSDRAGFAIANDTVITAHIPLNVKELTVIAADRRKLSGKVIARDHVTGLAAVRVPEADLTPLPLRVDPVAPGLPAVVTWLDDTSYATSRSVMIASEASPNPPEMGFTYEIDGNLQLAANGAAVVDANGVVIGIVVSESGVMAPSARHLRCVPSAVLSRISDHAAGDAPADLARGRIGIQFDAGSAVVTQVAEGSPGEQAGLRAGDRIVRLGDYKINDSTEVLAAVAMARGGDQVRVRLERDGETKDVKVTLVRQDPPRNQFGSFLGSGSLLPQLGQESEQAFRLEDGNLVPIDAEAQARIREEIQQRLRDVPGLNLDYIPGLKSSESDGQKERKQQQGGQPKQPLRDLESEGDLSERTIKDLYDQLQQLQRQLDGQDPDNE